MSTLQKVTSKRLLDLPRRVGVEVGSRLYTGQGMWGKSSPRCEGVPGWDRTDFIVDHLYCYITSGLGLISLSLPKQELGQNRLINY